MDVYNTILGKTAYVFSKQLEYYDNDKIQKLHQIFLFNFLIFVKVWLISTKAADAPVNDLMLWEPLNMYEKYGSEFARAVLSTLSRDV